ncbi:MAG: ABC transporter [Ruminococcaceae bacterium]|nr:ABC transporter [Oscillospiraceae bacterium]
MSKNEKNNVKTEEASVTETKEVKEVKEVKEEKKAKSKNSFNPFKNKKLKYGGLSVLFTVICIVVVVLINVVITMLGERFSVQADLTDSGLYSIEGDTAEYLSKVDDDIVITVTSEESAFVSGSEYYYQTNEILKKIVNCNDRFTLNYVNVVANPGFQANYKETLTSDQIIVESKSTKRVKVLNYDEYLSITYSQQYLQYFGQYVPEKIEANCEQAAVSAIMNVSDKDPVKVAVLTGFGETDNQVLTQLLETNSYIIETIDIGLTDKISDEFDFVFSFGPTSDYSVEVINKIDTWLDNNGKFGKNFIYASNPKLGDSPNIDGLLDDWGLKVEKGLLYQTDANYAYETRRTYQMLRLETSDFDKLTNESPIFGDNMSAVVPKWEGYGNMQTQILLSTYGGAVIRPHDAGDNWEPGENDVKKSYGVIVQSTKTRFENGTIPCTSRIITLGGMEMLNVSFLTSPQANNAQFIMNIFNVSCNKEEGITLTPKGYGTTTYEITEAQKTTLVIIFVAILPLALIIAGVIIWARRIHK